MKKDSFKEMRYTQREKVSFERDKKRGIKTGHL